LLDKGADVNAKTDDGMTALMQVSKALSGIEADLSRKVYGGNKALMDASKKSYLEVVKLLKAHGAEVSSANIVETADEDPELIRAARKGDRNEVIRLLDQGTDINARGGARRTALMFAAMLGQVDVVKALLDKGADVNAKDKYGGTPLMGAATWDDNVEVLKLLLDRGADVNAKDKYGITPLMVAVLPHFRNKDQLQLVVRIMLDKGADVNVRDKDGRTPLMLASERDYIDVVTALLDKGADANPKDENGMTPLIEACKRGHVDVAKLLLDKGADVNVKDNEGRTPLMAAAVTWRHSELVKLLKAHGAKE